jgi:hypothetical protein
LAINQDFQEMTMHQHTLVRIAAMLSLTVLSTASFAQSNEYRRGYEEGFAAGQRAAFEERGEHRGWRMHIEEAEYGARGAMCDARDAVRDQIERNDGAVHADNKLCGDPARGAKKHLRVVYRCGDSEPQQVFAREYETIRLSCRR